MYREHIATELTKYLNKNVSSVVSNFLGLEDEQFEFSFCNTDRFALITRVMNSVAPTVTVLFDNNKDQQVVIVATHDNCLIELTLSKDVKDFACVAPTGCTHISISFKSNQLSNVTKYHKDELLTAKCTGDKKIIFGTYNSHICATYSYEYPADIKFD